MSSPNGMTTFKYIGITIETTYTLKEDFERYTVVEVIAS